MKSINHLALFAKFWQPGSVKTRLAASIGSDLAAQVYFQFLSYLLQHLSESCNGETCNVRTIVYSPNSQRNEFESRWGLDWELVPQDFGDLGARMRTFFAEILSPCQLETKSLPYSQLAPKQLNPAPKPMITKNVGSEFGSTKKPAPDQKVVVIGSDCPLLGASEIESAFDCLDRQPVVIGPSTDGGYYLIGMRNEVAEVFDDISWSTPEVLPQTIQRLSDAKIGFELLPELTDIDEWSDLQEFLSQSAMNPETKKRHGPWLAEINALLADVRPADRKSCDPENLV